MIHPPLVGCTSVHSSHREIRFSNRHYTGYVGAWYTIGLALGLGLGFGVILSGLLGVNRVGAAFAAVAGAAAGAALGFAVGDLAETVAGAAAGLVGALSAATIVRGALRRGATRMGIAAYVSSVGLLVCLLALIPVIGYVVTVALPVLAARMRGRQAARYAGLRTLAK
jgi:hypothetical protein